MKNNIAHKIINFLLISTFLLLINSCAYFRLKELDKHNFSEDNIYDLVSKEYKEFAYSELYEMHDELDANYFAFKANNILKTKIIRIVVGTLIPIVYTIIHIPPEVTTSQIISAVVVFYVIMYFSIRALTYFKII